MRHTLSPLLLVVVGACAGPSGELFPPAVIPARPSAADWPDAGAAVLDEVMTVDFRRVGGEDQGPERLIAVVDHRRRLKILSEAGLSEAQLALPLDGFSTVTWVRGRSVSPAGQTRWLEPETARVVAVGGDVPDNVEVKRLVATIPGASVGGLVEYRYERVYADPDFLPVHVFAGPLPVLRSELGVVTSEGVRVDFRQGTGAEVTNRLPLRRRTADGRERLLWVEQGLPAFHPEPDAGHLGQVAPWVALVVTAARVGGETRRMETWAAVADKLVALQRRVGGAPDSGPAEKRFAALQAALRPVGLTGIGIRQPTAAKGLLRGEPACTRDAAAALLAALAGAEGRFYPAFLTGPAGPVLVPDLPGLYPFVGAAVAVDVTEQNARDPTCREDPVRRGLLCTVPADSYAFLDPTCRLCRYGELPRPFASGRALVVLDDGPRWVAIAEAPPERNRTMTQYRLMIDVDGSVRGSMSGELTGASLRRVQAGLGAGPPEEVLASQLLGEAPAVTLVKARVLGEETRATDLRFKAELSGKTERLDYEHYRVVIDEVVGPALPGRWRQSRHQPAVLDAPAWVETAAAIDLPVGYRAELPTGVTLVEPFAEYAAGFVRRDETVSFSRRLVIKRHVIAPAEWPAFRRFLDAIAAFEQAGFEVQSSDRP